MPCLLERPEPCRPTSSPTTSAGTGALTVRRYRLE